MRPEILFPLFQDVIVLPGIGPRLAALLSKAAGPRVKDVLFQLPTGLVDRSQTTTIAEAPDGQIITLTAKVEEHFPSTRQGKPYKVRLFDGTAFLHLVYFHARREYLEKLLPVGETRIVSGRAERFGSEIQIVHPDLVMSEDEAADTALLEPVYPLTAGLTAKVMRKSAAGALSLLPVMPEWQDEGLCVEHAWPDFKGAMDQAHHPQTAADLEPLHPARERLAFDELLAHQLALQLARARRKALPGRTLDGDNAKIDAVLANAPFKPTGAQTRAFEEIRADMALPSRMTRMLHGDVGAGKTFVAALAAAKAAESGTQTAIMAPTEILARQHARTLAELLAPAGMRVAILTGRDKGKARAEILEQMRTGVVDVVCGTHALFQDGVEFADLALVVIDEQHRFGVSDRMRLTAKGHRPDTLVMTATPIPRTLALAVHGDLDVSRLDEKPAGRIPPDTRLVPMERLDDVIEGVRRAISKGDRVYWVCPLVEESEVSELSAAEDRWRHLRAALGDERVGLIHGRMKAAEKESVATAFREGKMDVLVATTVIEVGVDAPDATVMIIEHAERFGLAQLHQLRGRVGRGEKPSSCLLLYKGPIGETAKARLEMMRETDDGFIIAEEDWRLRGAGDPLGLRQSGLPDFALARLEAHGHLIALANDTAKLAVHRDAELTTPRGEALRTLLYLFEQDRGIRLLKSG
ncbi:ATP-dependent DNA helicase RecG [Maricaulis salignorans]|uniref:ATP-dependent DNA helicase RecG n=1 Tax=Maricaulis salignorans TaxID=144026 RepID=A0A1G9P6X3_9PROT|nr:ATP-dependent DNA helicase RecG [Maricaulis salignorans]SDL94490.1 ATP-dependent DNA helicase RecG [Maricaulis salignorans]